MAASSLLALPILYAQTGKIYRVGLTHVGAEDTAKRTNEAFLSALRGYGYVEGRNLVYEVRYAGGDFGRVPTIVDEIIGLKPDVLAGFESVAKVMREKTSTIPIVLTNSADPVGLGLAQSLARPGGNVTGISTQWELFPSKQLEILREILPRLSRVGLLIDTTAGGSKIGEELTLKAARTIGVTIIPYRVKDRAEIDRALDQVEKDHPDALLFLASAVVYSFRERIYDRTLRLRIPFASSVPSMGDEGALLAYGPSLEQAFRDATKYVDKILKGARPGDLPIEQPTKFDLVINLKTAKTLRLKIPQSMLIRADRVIE
jgi:putative ABC transport system substrate-binding protein